MVSMEASNSLARDTHGKGNQEKTFELSGEIERWRILCFSSPPPREKEHSKQGKILEKLGKLSHVTSLGQLVILRKTANSVIIGVCA